MACSSSSSRNPPSSFINRRSSTRAWVSSSNDAVSVSDNAAAGSVVATFSADDPDTGDTFTYSIVSDPSNNFTIVGNELRVASGNTLHEDIDSEHIVVIRATDAGGLTYDEQINIDVVDSGASSSPIAFDLSGDGQINVTGETTARDKSEITEIGETVEFDMNGDGDLETIEWLDGTGDALLVDNRDGNAATDMNGTRLFGDQDGEYEHGYQQLAELDGNADGVISGSEMDGLELWVDNGDASVQEGELFTLSEMGISEINLELEEGAQDEEGRDLFRSTATTSDGSTIVTEDVWFAEVQEEEEYQPKRLEEGVGLLQDESLS